MSGPCVRSVAAGVEIRVFVQPRASRDKLVGLHEDELKVALTAPPVDGAANKACCRFFSRLAGVPKSAVRLVSGTSSRHKRVLVEGADLEKVRRALEALGLDISPLNH